MPRPIAFPIGGVSDGIVRLRLASDDDVPALAAAAQDPEISRYTRVPRPYGEADARHYLRSAQTAFESGGELATVICDAGSGALLGTAALHNIDHEHRRSAAGYWVAAEARDRGVATRALALICQWGFTELGLERIELWIEPSNRASIKVAERVGFAREGVARSYAEIDGRRRDMIVHSLLPDEIRRPAP